MATKTTKTQNTGKDVDPTLANPFAVPKGVVGRKVKLLQLSQGVDMLGSKTSLSSRLADITMIAPGVYHCVSKETGREVVLSHNVKAAELMPE